MPRKPEEIVVTRELAEQITQARKDLAHGKALDPLIMKMPRGKRPQDAVHFILTANQRDSLLACLNLQPALRAKLENAPAVGKALVPSLTDGDMVQLERGLSECFRYHIQSSHRPRIKAVLHRVQEQFLDEVVTYINRRAGKVDEIEKVKSRKTDRVFQFLVTLMEIEPPIWRRIQVPDCTLDEFNLYIQAAFGWENRHLHQFKINKTVYEIIDTRYMDLDDLVSEDCRFVLLSKLIRPTASRTRKWYYEYDLGDCWQHEIVFEGCPDKDPRVVYPYCLAGQRACPPEDVGGTGGYAYYLEAIADPEHEKHEELMGWRGPYNPEAFDVRSATWNMRHFGIEI